METPRLTACKTRVFVLLGLLVLFPTVVTATNVSVDCDAGGSINTALASLDPVGPHTITVTGTCTENVNINLRNQITIQAPDGQTATIQASNPPGNSITISGSKQIVLNRLIIRGGRNGVSINQGSVVNIHNSTIAENNAVGILFTQSTLTIDSSTIRDNALTGLAAQAASLGNVGGPLPLHQVVITGNGTGVSVLEGFLQFNGNFLVEENNNFGFDVAGGRLNLSGMQAGMDNSIRANGGGAINLRNAATGLIFGHVVIQNNTGNGINVSTGSNLTMNEVVLPNATVLTTTIEGHPVSGLTLSQQSQASIAGRHKIRNNGSSPETCVSTICGGIRVFSGSQLTLRGGTEVTNNTGPGVNVEHNSALLINSPIVITGNSQEGIRQFINASTVIGVTSTPAPGTNDISSVVCDDSSLIAGDLQGIAKVSCKVAKPFK